MADLEKVAEAKAFIDKMANGINPLDDSEITEKDFINDVRIVRRLFLVSQVLGKVLQDGGLTKPEKGAKQPFKLNDVLLSDYPYSEKPLTMSEFLEYFNQNVDLTSMKKLQPKALTDWLVENEYLKIIEAASGNHYKSPTEKGNQAGIFTEMRFGSHGYYIALLFNKEAQKLLVENLPAIIEAHNGAKQTESGKAYPNQGTYWTREAEESLAEMFKQGLSVKEMSESLQRSPSGIRARLIKLGLITNTEEAQ